MSAAEEENPIAPPQGPASDPVQVKERARKANSLRQREIDDMFFILSTIQGRRFIWRLLDRCGHNRLSFVPRDHDLSVFNEGMRNIGLKILADVREADPQAEVTMQAESKKEAQSNG